MEYSLPYNHQSQFIEMFGNPTQFAKKKVHNLFCLSMGKTPSRANSHYWDQDGYKWASISDMGAWEKYSGETAEHISMEAVSCTGIKPVPKNTIIMSFKLSIGRTCITTSDLYTNEAIMAFLPLTDAFNLDYLHFYIANYNWSNGAKQAVKGATLNKESIGNALFILPPQGLQEEFASIVRQADKSKFDGFKSQFIEMFGNPFDECSDKVSLSSLCIINPSRPKDLDDSLPVSFIPMHSISEEGEYSTFTSRPLGEVKKGFTYCADEDVLFAKITPCMENGKGAMLKVLSNGIGFGSTEFHVLRPLPGVTTSTWLYNLTKLDILRKDAAKNMTGTGGQKRVPASYLETFSVLPPSIELQEEFAAISQQADKSKYYVQNKLNYICHILTKQIQLKRCS